MYSSNLNCRAGKLVSSVNLVDIFIFSRHVCHASPHSTQYMMHNSQNTLHKSHDSVQRVDSRLDQVARDYGCLYSTYHVLLYLEDSVRDPGANFQVTPQCPPPPSLHPPPGPHAGARGGAGLPGDGNLQVLNLGGAGSYPYLHPGSCCCWETCLPSEARRSS